MSTPMDSPSRPRNCSRGTDVVLTTGRPPRTVSTAIFMAHSSSMQRPSVVRDVAKTSKTDVSRRRVAVGLLR